MKVLDRYIIKEILKGTFITLIILYTLFNLFTLKDELKFRGVGDYDLPHILMYIGLLLPHYLYELMPSAALLGSLFVLGNMANHRELVAMRVSGVSILRIIRSVMLAGMILVCFSFVMGEFIAPDAEKKAKILRNVAKTHRDIVRMEGEIWLREGNQFINIQRVYTAGDVANIFLYELDEQQHLKQIVFAGRGRFLDSGLWQLQNVVVTDISKQGVSTKSLPESTWKSVIDQDVVDVVVLDPENLSLYELAKYIRFLQENKQDADKYALAFWARLINPFITLVMLLVATPFVVGVGRGVALGPRMVAGVLIGMGFNIVDNTVGQMGVVYGLNPLFVAVLPSSLVLMGALYAISRLR